MCYSVNDFNKTYLSYLHVLIQIDGSYKFKIPVAELEELFNSLSGNTFVVSADVTERTTGNILSGSSEIRFYSHAEKMMFIEGAKNFKPGMTYSSFVRNDSQSYIMYCVQFKILSHIQCFSIKCLDSKSVTNACFCNLPILISKI